MSETIVVARGGSRRPPVHRVPPHAYFLVSAVFHYLGPAFAVLLFARIDVLGVAWLRITVAAVIFAVWRRPWRRWSGLDRAARRLLLAWGVVLAAMNSVFYVALDRLPLGTVAAVEFVPVLLLAAYAVRSRRNAAALALAGFGVWLLTDVRLVAEPVGMACAAANAALFAAYITLAHRASRQPELSGLDALGSAMVVAAVVAAPVGVGYALPAFVDPVALAAAVGVAVCSSVIPYVFDQLAMARLARGTYALMTSLLPATAAVIGFFVLRQRPTVGEAVGVLLVVAAVATHRPPGSPRESSRRSRADGRD
ncbi:DMT family transporter [Plantactinospora sp. GCM10030261]|uniref:EamA family transporter n=1 Tax=Plantactinospora sp. GCM10030261 TaxID=3273420 RepID=UPI0036155DCC